MDYPVHVRCGISRAETFRPDCGYQCLATPVTKSLTQPSRGGLFWDWVPSTTRVRSRPMDYEIRAIRFTGAVDCWGPRVWANCNNPEGEWLVSYRPEVDRQFPVKFAPAGTFERALEIGRDFVTAYRHERSNE